MRVMMQCLSVTLESQGRADNTVIVFTSDNGYHLGEKECIQKWHLWGESIRLPMKIHVPSNAGNGCDCHHPVSHIDLCPALIELCGLPPEPHAREASELDGHPLVPFLDDPKSESWAGPAAALTGIRGSFMAPRRDTKCQLREELAAILNTSKVPEDYRPTNVLDRKD